MGLKSNLHNLKEKYKGTKMAPAFNAIHTFLYLPNEVTHNGKTTQTRSNKHTIHLDKGINNISISTGIECQGIFQQSYLNSYEVKYAPNPFKETLQLYFGGKDNLVELGVYTSNGQLIDHQTVNLPFGVRNYSLEIVNYPQGIYIISVKGQTLDQSIQVIKE